MLVGQELEGPYLKDKLKAGLREGFRWESACLAARRPRVQSLVPLGTVITYFLKSYYIHTYVSSIFSCVIHVA
jgi:hypothetical protein